MLETALLKKETPFPTPSPPSPYPFTEELVVQGNILSMPVPSPLAQGMYSTKAKMSRYNPRFYNNVSLQCFTCCYMHATSTCQI